MLFLIMFKCVERFPQYHSLEMFTCRLLKCTWYVQFFIVKACSHLLMSDFTVCPLFSRSNKGWSNLKVAFSCDNQTEENHGLIFFYDIFYLRPHYLRSVSFGQMQKCLFFAYLLLLVKEFRDMKPTY